MSKRKSQRTPVESAVETALRETGGVTVTGGSGLPTVVRGAPRDPFEGLDEPMMIVPADRDEWKRVAPLPDPEVAALCPPEFAGDPEAIAVRPTLPSATRPMDGAAKGIRWEPGPVWSDRIERMAEARALSVEGFLESLLRRAWVSTPAGLRKGG